MTEHRCLPFGDGNSADPYVENGDATSRALSGIKCSVAATFVEHPNSLFVLPSPADALSYQACGTLTKSGTECGHSDHQEQALAQVAGNQVPLAGEGWPVRLGDVVGVVTRGPGRTLSSEDRRHHEAFFSHYVQLPANTGHLDPPTRGASAIPTPAF